MIADLFDPPIFAEVKIGSRSEQPCSPPVPSLSWRGVVIAAPRKVTGAPGARFQAPICGQFVLPMTAKASSPRGVIHVAISGERPIRPMPIGLDTPRNEAPPERGPPLTAKMTEGLASGGYFSFDLGDLVTPPDRPVTINLVLEMRGAMSEPVAIEWVPAGKR